MTGSVDSVIVETVGGGLRGSAEAGLAVFRGVPYAAPPVGELRWRATEPHSGWAGVRDAVRHGPVSPQPRGLPHDGVHGTSGTSFAAVDEDCLSLTIWTPGTDDTARPVLVWIHGGGAVVGAGSWDIYSGDRFAGAGDVVVVSINYRIGPFGYLYVENGDGGRGNFWLDDMLAALRWVRDNIAAFGGDPGNVTVAGQSGGAQSILSMMGVPAAKGLFQRAILQSAPIGYPDRGLDEARRITARYFEMLGVSSVEGARALPADALIAPLGDLTAELSDWNVFTPPFWKVLDGVTLDRQPLRALADGGGADIEVLLGWTREEHAFFCVPDPSMREVDRERVLRRLRLSFGDAAPRAYAEYAKARPGALPIQVLVDVVGDERIRMGGVELAELRAAQGKPAFVYQFDWQSAAFDGLLGAPHCLDLPFVFNNFDAWSDAGMLAGTESPQRQALAEVMHAAWIAFVRTGDPNHDGLPAWEPYRARRTTMRFDTVTQPVDDLVGHWRRAWNRLGGRQL